MNVQLVLWIFGTMITVIIGLLSLIAWLCKRMVTKFDTMEKKMEAIEEGQFSHEYRIKWLEKLNGILVPAKIPFTGTAGNDL